MSERVEFPETHAQRSDDGRSSGLRLKELMTFVIVLALACYFWGFFKKARAHVAFESFEVLEDNLQNLEGDWNKISSSPYRWQYLTNEQLQSVLGDHAAPYRGKRTVVSKWSQRFFDRHNHSAHGRSIDDTSSFVSLGTIQGTVGARTAGDMLQLRIDLAVRHQQMDKKYLRKPSRVFENELEGTIRYEGYAPKQYLLFAAPLKDSVQHVLVFETKRIYPYVVR